VEHCKCHLLNPFYIAFPNKELQKEGGDKASVEAMIDYTNKHDIPLSSIPEQPDKEISGRREGCVVGILALGKGEQLSR
jgi:hypothetical protein